MYIIDFNGIVGKQHCLGHLHVDQKLIHFNDDFVHLKKYDFDVSINRSSSKFRSHIRSNVKKIVIKIH